MPARTCTRWGACSTRSLTGEPPFIGDTPVAVAYQHVRKEPVPPSQRNRVVSPDLDAVVLKALAKNPDNRYQTAAEMRADLMRVHDGESPEAPKVLTEALRASLLSAGASRRAQQPGEKPRYIGGRRSRRAPLTRWVGVVAVLAVLTAVVTALINMAPGWFANAHLVEVPDVVGKPRADAVVVLQKAGFEAKTQQVTNPEVAPDRVVSTVPKAGVSAGSGSTVTLNVSVGAEQRPIPDVASLTYEDAVRRLTAAGFGRVTAVRTPSTPAQKDKVIGTDPAANQTAPVTFEISVIVGFGPEMVSVPDLVGQIVDQAQMNLRVLGFTKFTELPVDSTKPAGEVTDINPAAGQRVPKDTVIKLQVSKGNQFLLPDLTGKFWDDLLPLLQSYGWTGVANTDTIPSGDDNRARVIRQDPPPNTPVRRDGTIKLTFGE